METVGRKSDEWITERVQVENLVWVSFSLSDSSLFLHKLSTKNQTEETCGHLLGHTLMLDSHQHLSSVSEVKWFRSSLWHEQFSQTDPTCVQLV